ncbi:MAG: isochorismatase family protein [Planctomycetota bacterium]
MKLLNPESSIVVVIDLQGKLMEMIYKPDRVVKSTVRLLKLADLFRVPVVLTEQYPQGLGSTLPEVRAVYDSLTTEKWFQEKTSFGCCGDPDFERMLRELRPNVAARDRQVVIGGIEAHVCVMQTVIELLAADYEVHLCWECVSSRGEEYRANALDRMCRAGAVKTNHESVGFEWARHKDHPAFKEMSRLFKEGQIV